MDENLLSQGNQSISRLDSYTVSMDDFNRKVEDASRMGEQIRSRGRRNASEKETAEFITYLNDEVVPRFRQHSTLRVAAEKMSAGGLSGRGHRRAVEPARIRRNSRLDARGARPERMQRESRQRSSPPSPPPTAQPSSAATIPPSNPPTLAASSIITAECEQAAGKSWRNRHCHSRLRQTALR
jgi:hypothetical protein